MRIIRHQSRNRLSFDAIAPMMDSIVELMVHDPQLAAAREEADTNKRFHLSQKEYAFVPTLAGHAPVKPGVYITTNEAK